MWPRETHPDLLPAQASSSASQLIPGSLEASEKLAMTLPEEGEPGELQALISAPVFSACNTSTIATGESETDEQSDEGSLCSEVVELDKMAEMRDFYHQRLVVVPTLQRCDQMSFFVCSRPG